MDAMLAITALGKTIAEWLLKKSTRRQVMIQKNHVVNELDDFEEAFMEAEQQTAKHGVFIFQ